jgi:thioredoxin 1
MAMQAEYPATEPRRTEVEALPGPTLLEFGSPWCGHCRRAQPLIAQAFAEHPGVRHIKVADVKLWPTLVFLKDGKEAARVVRPVHPGEITQGLARIDPQA